ncbi:putative retrotransposon gag domain, aspartic peptidase domain superfamily [Helianthus annuus]|nr:putative retrotransposon gag domain, aspartic peptidase domain superfamily [Helianthus annuus]
MAEGTRARTMEETVKGVQTDQKAMRQELDGVVTAIASLQHSINELIKRSDGGSGMKKPVFLKPTSGPDGEGTSVLGRHKPAPVYLARFSGDHPERWLAQAGRYFEFYDIPERDRLTISSFYFDDAAADWYDWLHRHHQISSWEAFTVALLKRFRSSDFEEPEGLLAKLQQTTTVADYRSRFEAISNRTMPLPVDFLIRCWISGLRCDIKQSVICHGPTTLEDAMDKAQLHERRIQFERGLGRVSLGSSKPLLPTPKTSPLNSQNPSALPAKPTTPATSKVGFRHLSSAEMAQKRAQGLCYRCDEKYTWDHKCKSAPQLLFFDDEPPDLIDPPVSPSSEGTDSLLAEKLQLDEVKTQSAISYNALSGGCSSTTLRFTGLIHGKEVQVLLDGGSTHCFVQTRIAKFLNLTIESIEPFSVLVGSGKRLPCSGLARAVEVVIQGQPIVADFYVLPLQGWDMVLGVSWLATLGPVITDYSTSIFEFSLNGQQVKWQGDVTMAQAIQFHGFRHLLNSDCHTPTNGGNIGMRRSVKIARDIITLFVTIFRNSKFHFIS